MPFPPLASGASAAPCLVLGFLPPRLDHRYLDGFRRFLLVRHHRRELSSSKKICRKMRRF